MREPVAKQVPHTWERVTGSVDDPYAWLRDRDDPNTIAYLEAENAHSDAWYAPHTGLVEEVYREIRSRIQETDVAAPVPKGEWFYSSRTIEGQSYPIHCRGRTAATATDIVLLDENLEAVGHDYFDVADFETDPAQRLAAWSADTNGDQHYTIRIRDLVTGTDLADRLDDTSSSGVAWSSDSRFLFYTVPDEQNRAYRVMRHLLGTPQDADVEVFTEDDGRFIVGIGATRNDAAIIIYAGSKTSSEIRILDPADPTGVPALVRPRRDDVEYHLDHWGDRWAVLTNLDAVDFRVMTAPLDDPATWTELVPHRAGHRITNIDPYAGHLVLHVWQDAQPTIRVVDRVGGDRTLVIDTEPHDVEFGPNEVWDTTTLRLVHQSLTTPARVIDVDVVTGAIDVVKTTPTPNVDLGDYVASRRWATADDGTQVPVDIVHHRDTPLDGTAPCCVYGYGSYEIPIPPWFSVARLSLLDRGAVWALVHPRGGGELGRQWYLDGKLLAKRNTFTDALAVCDHLVETGIAAPDRVAIRGGSAGGLLVGACVTMRPDRFRAAVAEVPFVDVVNTMSDPSLPLTITEWDEWGDPRVEPFASYILSYSPYDNTVPADYPALLVTAGLNDPLVSFHEPAKWVARLRAVRTATDRPVLLRTEMGSGHGGPSGRYDAWRDEARVLTFLLANLR